ncbi:MAG: carbonic anhydrase family protein [Robiginitomaculum sp.]|nr:carbonic anhydrase family protein [Robiginitomaculum sp.]
MINHKTSILSALTVGLFLTACQPAAETEKPETVVETTEAKPKKISWSYSGDNGPEHWASLSENFATCASGTVQSPFDITADKTDTLPALNLNYVPTGMTVINNGHTIQVDQAGGGQLVVGDATYNLLQFHFHTASEYSIDGKFYPLEVHLVHASDAGALAVVGVMFAQGEANAELANIWANMPTSKGENVVAGQSVDVKNLLPDSGQYYRFMGSLTTPPCSEGVNWHVMSQPITASAAQIAAYRAIHPMNARPLQDGNNRLVVLGK